MKITMLKVADLESAGPTRQPSEFFGWARLAYRYYRDPKPWDPVCYPD